MPSFASPSAQCWVMGVIFRENRPTWVGENVILGVRVPGSPGGVKLFHVAADSVQASVTWYASSVTPLFVTVSSRLAFTIREPAGICPGAVPKIAGNWRRVLHTDPTKFLMQSFASTNSFVSAP